MKGDVLRLYSMRFCPFAQVGFLFSGIASEGNTIKSSSMKGPLTFLGKMF